jgi:oligoendopeptidase F
METLSSIIAKRPRSFLPENFLVQSWDEMEPLFTELEARDFVDFQSFETWLKDWDEINAVIGEDMRLKYIQTSINTANEEAKAALENFYIYLEPQLKVWENKLQIKFAASPYKTQLGVEFNNFKRGIEKDLALFNEENIQLSKELSLIENQYSEITGAWTINYDNKELTLSQANKYLKNQDRHIRESVFMLLAERQAKDAEALDTMMSTLVAKRHQLAVQAGYKDFRDFTFDAKHRFDYTAQDCEAFHESVANEIIPLLKEIDGQRKQAMSLPSLKPWDMQVDPLNREALQAFQSTEDFIQKTIRCFNKLDPYFGACVKHMDEANMLDLESRKAKAQGGYMMSMPETGVPFIFMNHAFSEGDVRVMVHEGGHAVHSFLDFAIPFAALRDTPSEVAELASMSMELFTLENWESYYENKEDLKRAKKNHLEGILKMLPNIAKGDAFQHWMYTNPEHTIEERHAKWMELGKKFGTGVVDNSGLETFNQVSYQAVLHFYQVPFYFIEYGFAQLGAIALWRNYKQNPNRAISQYKDALSLGYTKTIPEIYRTAGIQFNFSRSYVQELALFVQTELSRL